MGDTDCPTLCGKLPFHIVRRGGLTLGFIGLMEQEWIGTLHTNSEDELEYTDFAVVGAQLADVLKSEHHCDVVVAVTHMRLPNDRLAARIPGVDLVLGGHDHHYVYEPPAYAVVSVDTDAEPSMRVQAPSAHLVKSGTNFRDMSVVRISARPAGGVDISVERHSITSAVPEDPEMMAVVKVSGPCVDTWLAFLNPVYHFIPLFKRVHLNHSPSLHPS
jgi:5'-nucleotidase